MELSSHKLKKFIIFPERTYKAPKTNKKYAPKKFLVSCDVFLIFTAVKHKEIPCEANLKYNKPLQLFVEKRQFFNQNKP